MALTYLCSLLCQDSLTRGILFADVAAGVKGSHKVTNVSKSPASRALHLKAGGRLKRRVHSRFDGSLHSPAARPCQDLSCRAVTELTSAD